MMSVPLRVLMLLLAAGLLPTLRPSAAQLAPAPSAVDTLAADTLAADALGTDAALLTRPFPPSPPEAPLRGVVWDVPDDVALAEADLRRMALVGVQAVRTELVTDERLLTLADRLGLRLFQELPLSFVPAAELDAALTALRPRLDAALARAGAHPSARHFGLIRSGDTSDTTACAALADAAARVRAAVPGAATYYVTPFVVSDRCGAAVDFVLLDALDAPAPASRLAAWRAAHPDVDAGIGALGTWAGGGTGLRAPHSPETQARYLEAVLPALIADTTAAPAVFVHRWRDRGPGDVDPLPALHGVRGRRYGLLTDEDTPRPAFTVVRGLYTGAQSVFAFPQGEAEAPRTAWSILLGWGVFLLLGVFYALSPRFRHMVPRYFRAHGFYREAIREGRDVLLGTSAVLLLALSVSVGLVATVIVRALRDERAFALFVRWLPDGLQAGFVSLLDEPFALVLLCAGVHAVALLVWASALSLASRRRHLLAPGQAVMLIVWPRWTALVLAVGALVVSTLPPPLALDGALVLFAAWAVTSTWATARTLYDYLEITRVPGRLLLAAAVGNPLVLVLVVGFFFALEHRARLAFLLHLALRG